ncbi:RluA family pseudouridine synthase [bacterium]|nr:RluA family pseudouridine synthase [bacterium]
MATRKLQPPAEAMTLLPFLLGALRDSNRTRVKDLLRSGLVHINDASVTRHDHPVSPGDQIEIRDERAPGARNVPFPVLFEDSSLIAINKPCGLLSIGTDSERHKTAYAMLNAALATTRERVFIVHRLDRYTSGVLLLAKSEEIKHRVMGNWEAAEKVYHALVEGTPQPATKALVHHLREDERLVVHAMDRPAPNSQWAKLTYTVVRPGRTHALLRIDLETGRKNQIRAQLTAIGHPIAGDAKYGAKTDPLRRLGLHASSLSIPHPVTGKRIQFEAPLPPEFGGIV